MTIDPGAKQDVEAWTTFTASADIPDWISKAYIDSYRGPRDDSSEATKAAEASWLPASLLTPAMLGAHYRLGRHRAAGESCVAVYRADDPAGFGPALQVVAEHGGMLMDSVTVLLRKLGNRLRGDSDPGVRRAPQPHGRAAAHRTEGRGHVAAPG